MNKRPEHKNECKDAPLPTITNDSMAAGSPHPPFGQKPSPEEIWEKVDSNMSDFYTNVDDVLIEAFKKLNSKSSKSELITNILSFIKLFENGKYSPR